MAAFTGALSRMQLWYAHQLTTVFLMTPPDGGKCDGKELSAAARAYHSRGWPTFERHVCMLGKRTSQWQWPLIVDVGTGAGTSVRVPPLAVETFRDLLATKTFTNGADVQLVAGLYAKTTRALVTGARVLKYGGLGWGDEEIAHLCVWLPLCTRLKELSLIANNITDKGAHALADVISAGGLPNLTDLNINSNQITHIGADMLNGALKRTGREQHRRVRRAVGRARAAPRLSLGASSMPRARLSWGSARLLKAQHERRGAPKTAVPSTQEGVTANWSRHAEPATGDSKPRVESVVRGLVGGGGRGGGR